MRVTRAADNLPDAFSCFLHFVEFSQISKIPIFRTIQKPTRNGYLVGLVGGHIIVNTVFVKFKSSKRIGEYKTYRAKDKTKI